MSAHDLEARRDATDLVRLLGPACERIEPAGSVRRGAARVRDIDLVLVPKLAPQSGRSSRPAAASG